MVIKLEPEQLVKFWDMIRYVIAETFIPRKSCTNAHLQAILASLLSGKSQCWMGFKMVEGERKFVGFIITRVAVDPSVGERILSIDHMYAYQTPTDELREMCWVTLAKFAMKNSCKSLVAITLEESLARKAEAVGFDVRYYLVKEL